MTFERSRWIGQCELTGARCLSVLQPFPPVTVVVVPRSIIVARIVDERVRRELESVSRLFMRLTVRAAEPVPAVRFDFRLRASLFDRHGISARIVIK